MSIHDMLIMLAKKNSVCSMADKGKETTWSGLRMYEPLLKSDPEYFEKYPDACYVFEVGLNCGHVFSEKLVRSIELTKSGAIIHLKS